MPLEGLELVSFVDESARRPAATVIIRFEDLGVVGVGAHHCHVAQPASEVLKGTRVPARTLANPIARRAYSSTRLVPLFSIQNGT